MCKNLRGRRNRGEVVFPVSRFMILRLVFTTIFIAVYPITAFRSSSRHLSNNCFSSLMILQEKSTATNSNLLLFSSIGDNDDAGGGGADDSDNNLGEFLDPMKKPESEDMTRARQYMSETSLPISFDGIVGDDNDFDGDETNIPSKNRDKMTNEDENSALNVTSSSTSFDAENTNLTGSSSSLVSSSLGNATKSALFVGSDDDDNDDDDESQKITGPSPSLLAKNPYMQVVSKISPSDLIAKFTAESDPRVQEAVKTTILGLIGSLPKLAFETTSITTGQRLASLMFQLQMTGYMFKNAEYRLSMSQSLGMSQTISSNLLLQPGIEELPDTEDDPLVSGKLKGKLKIRYKKNGEHNTNRLTDNSLTEGQDEIDSPPSSPEATKDGMEIEVDAEAFMSELRAEVSNLRDELTETKEAKDDTLRKDLLLYIRTLPAKELKSLTDTMSEDVLVCMKGLVQAVLAGIGDGKIGPDTVTEQSGEAMAQLCMWQLAVGYNLRELEVREEMKQNLKSLLGDDTQDELQGFE